jgi:signal transduction histidine kinase
MISFDWRYIYVNNTVVKQSRFTREKLLNRTIMEVYPGIENTELFKSLKLCMNARIPKRFENEFNFPDNSSGWFDLSVQPVKEGIIILSMDITERKKSEIKDKRYTSGMERMLNMTSHKLRQPVAHILGLTNILKDFSGSPAELAKIISYLNESAVSLDNFTKDLTDYLENLQKRTKNKG